MGASKRAVVVAWVASLTIALVILYTSILNVVYLIEYGNVVRVEFQEVYGATRDWAFGAQNTGNIDPEVVYDFLASNDSQVTVKLLHAFLTQKDSQPQVLGSCVGRLGEDAGSIYGMCDKLDYSRMPKWASNFEAITIQSAYLASPQEFRDGLVSSFLSVFQAYTSQRKGWFEEDGIKRMHCSTENLARPVDGFASRIIYTKVHGMLQNVDCSSEIERLTVACRTIDDNPSIVLFDDGSSDIPKIQMYEVFRTSQGEDFIFHPFSATALIGQQIKHASAWPLDNCLLMKDDSFAWFGVGYTRFDIHIPSMALIAKVQLIVVIAIIWRAKYQASPSRLHDALFQSTRLGLFPVVVIQILISSYYEQDIMRSIYAWEENTPTGWVLWLYLLISVSTSVSLMGIQTIRFLFSSDISFIGCNLAIGMLIPVAITENILASVLYSEHTVENGLLPRPSIDCPQGYVSCAVGKFNFLYLVCLFAFVPAGVEKFLRYRRLHPRIRASVRAESKDKDHEKDGKSRSCERTMSISKQEQELTSFELICLEGEAANSVVTDVAEPYIIIQGKRHISPLVVSACGFTMIKNRFLVRTKDLIWILVAALSRPGSVRDTSTVIWPLKLAPDGTLTISHARRVFLRSIRKFAIENASKASLLAGVEEPTT